MKGVAGSNAERTGSLDPSTRSFLGRSSRPRAVGYALATAGTAALVALLLPIRGHFTPLSNGFGFLTLVVVTGAIGGLGPGIVASLAGFLAFNFFFIPPYDTFAIGRGEDVVVLFVFLGLSILISILIARATARAEAAEARERELRALQDLSRALVEHGADPQSYAVVVKLVVARFGFRDGALFIQQRADATGLDELVVVNAEPGSVPLSAEGPGIERQALNIGSRNLGVLVLRGDRLDITVSERRVLRAFSDQLALVLERDRMLRVATEASRRSQERESLGS
jgi:two-component system sensor histidine kinase KdpD